MKLKIVVSMKVVPKPEEVRVNEKDMTLDRAQARNEINKPDKNAIEMALSFRERYGGEVILLSMGPPFFTEFLQLGIAMGADQAILLSDRTFAGADTLPTSLTLASGIKKIGEVDMVLCGEESADSATGQVPPGIAEWLDYSLLTYVTELELMKDGRLKGKRARRGGHEWLAVPFPTVVSVELGCNLVRFPDFERKKLVGEDGVMTVWNADDLGVEEHRLGLAGSPTRVNRLETAKIPARRKEKVDGSVEKIADKLYEVLKDYL
ncbi:MAG: electron transfer flavoprotein subunit beta/FixA family protein [Candidatus Neomarinimicrobiota bacterium]